MRTPNHRTRGVALVLILGVLALVLVLAIGFLTRAASERVAAASYEAGLSARALGSTAVGIVQAQIDQASRAGNGTTWISQPGMIRVFRADGSPDSAAKLYSATTLAAGTGNLNTALLSDIPSADWRNRQAEWVDLNSPAVLSGVTTFPILDPRAAETASVAGAVEGFRLTPLAGATGWAQEAEMPVRWLYCLRNGEVVAPVSASANRVEFDPAVVTSANPIVGRIAFWTDDDSCKVNINTAGEGTFWDVPRTMSAQDAAMGNYQPALGEFVRYAGHPATTSLSAVFPAFNAQTLLSSGLFPRYSWGGSNGGVRVATTPIDPKSDRLYSSATELLFDPRRDRLMLDTAEVDAAEIAQRMFFLTAHSRAPETNAFNLPRVAIWPIHVNETPAYRTEFDQLIARAASINDQPYFVQRERAESTTHDFVEIDRNRQLYAYLQALGTRTAPGSGGSFAAKYLDNWNQIVTQMFDYIRSANLVDPLLDDAPDGIPYAGKSVKSDEGEAMAPGFGTVAPFRHPTNNTLGFGRFYTLAEFSLHFICTADGDDTDPADPLYSNVPPDGAGGPPNRNLTLDTNTPLQAGQRRIMAAVHLRLFSPAQGWVTMQPRMQVEVDGLNSLRLGGQPLFPGSANARMDLGRHGADAGHLGAAYGGNPGTHYPLYGKRAPARGNLPADPSGSWAEDLYPFISNPVTVTPAGTPPQMTFQGGAVTVRLYTGDSTSANPELVQTINIVVPDGNFPVPHLVRTAPGQFFNPPSAQYVPLPNYSAQYFWSFGQSGAVPGVEPRGRLHGAARGEAIVIAESFPRATTGSFFHEDDVVRSMVVRHGDHRLIAGRSEVPNTEFIAHPAWNTPSARFASHLYSSRPSIYWPPGYDSGTLLNPQSAEQRYRQDIPSTRATADAPIITRDFDNGTAAAMDGAYINKPDEGNTYRGGTAIPYMYGGNIVGDAGSTFFSPSRQMPSPGVMGSLPSQTISGQPWRTLLFRPQENHPSWNVAPRDHWLMDLFWMPVVEPYAISEPFSTAGKINLNQQIVPFTHIERQTGLHALLKGEKLGAIPITEANTYKYKDSYSGSQYRIPIDVAATVTHWKARFATGGAFRSASEICDLYVIPQGQSVNPTTGAWANATSFWVQNRLTGDNLRERIYTTLYPRVTVRSNIFTVHFWSQALKPRADSPAHVWEEFPGAIVGSYRGRSTIERFIDPNNSAIPNYAAESANLATLPTLDTFYRWRTLGTVQFSP